MDIGRGCGYPASSLSNFAPHPFVIDGVECASMEGFLQSLKFASPDIQVEVCKLDYCPYYRDDKLCSSEKSCPINLVESLIKRTDG